LNIRGKEEVMKRRKLIMNLQLFGVLSNPYSRRFMAPDTGEVSLIREYLRLLKLLRQNGKQNTIKN